MGRENSHGTKELLNLPVLGLKARDLSGSAFALVYYAMPDSTEMASPRLELVLEDKLFFFYFHVATLYICI